MPLPRVALPRYGYPQRTPPMLENRLKTLDATFLNFEGDDQNMCVGGCDVFAGPAPSFEEFVASMEARLEAVPHFRLHRVRVPLGLGRPRWADDEAFAVSNHLRHTALPAPGDASQLQEHFADLMGRPIDHGHPPWEIWMVEGVAGGRFALLHKMHHALVDGIASVKVLEALFDSSPDGMEIERVHKDDQPHPGRARLLAEGLLERTMAPEIVGAAVDAVRHPRRTAEELARTSAGLWSVARSVTTPAPPSPYNTRLGPRRSFSWQRESLDDVKAVKDALDGSVNDVVLSVVAGALRADLERRGADIGELELVAFVPVSVRPPEDGAGVLGNDVSGLRVKLPIDSADARERFDRVHEEMGELKESPQVFGASAAVDSTAALPPGLLERLTPVGDAQRYANLVITNVPGPAGDIYLDGRRLEDVFAFVPVGANMALGVAILSYADTLTFGFAADSDALPDVDVFPGLLHAALEELGHAAGVELTAPAPADAAADAAGGAPWAGYDDHTVAEIEKRLASCDRATVRRVGAYERANKDRAGVRRAVEAAGG